MAETSTTEEQGSHAGEEGRTRRDEMEEVETGKCAPFANYLNLHPA